MRCSIRGSAMPEHGSVAAGQGTLPADESVQPVVTAPPAQVDYPGAAERALSTRQLAWRRFRRHKLAIVGGLAGYYGGWLDNLLMRFTDLFLSIPFLVILIVGSRIHVFQGVKGIILLLALFFWMGDARIVRGVFLSLKQKEFVEAARASGARDRRIIFYHVLPNVAGPIVVNLTLLVANAILTESALSFLGFGIQPPTPSWGN